MHPPSLDLWLCLPTPRLAGRPLNVFVFSHRFWYRCVALKVAWHWEYQSSVALRASVFCGIERASVLLNILLLSFSCKSTANAINNWDDSEETLLLVFQTPACMSLPITFSDGCLAGSCLTLENNYVCNKLASAGCHGDIFDNGALRMEVREQCWQFAFALRSSCPTAKWQYRGSTCLLNDCLALHPGVSSLLFEHCAACQPFSVEFLM